MTKRQLNQYRRQFKKMNLNQKLSLFAGVFTLTLLVLLAISSIFLQKRLKEEKFDARKEAWVDQGTVILNTVPAPGTTFQAGEEATIDIILNTGPTFIDGLQLNFGINSDDNGILTNTETNLTAMDLDGLNFHVINIIYPFCGDQICYSAQILATTTLNNIEDGYTTHGNDVVIARFTFTPQITGEFQFTFNGSEYIDRSYAIDSADHQTDQLQRINNFHYYVAETDEVCEDTDGGKIFEEFGTASNAPILAGEEYLCDDDKNCDDFCFAEFDNISESRGSGNYINEWFCEDMADGDTYISYERKACSDLNSTDDNYTCQNGYCVNQSPQTCDAPYTFGLNSSSCNANGQTMTANLDWSDIFGATQYQVEISSDPNFAIEPIAVDLIGESELTKSDLPPGTWYTRVRVSESSPNTCTVEENWTTPIEFTQDCDPQAPQCTYDCTWGSCNNNWRTLNCSTTNEPCEDYNGSNQNGRVEYCGATSPVNSNLYIYNYEACWYNNSFGETTYVIWNNSNFSNASWLDVSPYSDFREFANKNISDRSSAYYENYLVTDGNGFTWNNDGRDFSFEPGTWYYFRLFNGAHSQVASFYMPRCAGTGGPDYQYCNEDCNHNSDCTSSLTCYQGSCRLPSNVDSDVCAPLPGDINRACNEYCADASECANGLSCWWNRCRHPENLEDTQCRAPVEGGNVTGTYVGTATYLVYTQPGVTYSYETKTCNEYCTANAQCEPNHRCYENRCRLAVNPESTICDPYDMVGTKGADEVEEKLSPTAAITHEPIDTSLEEDDKPIEEQTALDALKQYLEDKGISPTTLALVLGGSLIFLIVLLIVLSRKASEKDGDDRTPPPSAMVKSPPWSRSAPGAGPVTPPPSKMISKLKNKGIKPPGG